MSKLSDWLREQAEIDDGAGCPIAASKLRKAAKELDRMELALKGIVRVSKPIEIDGEQWIAIPRAAWMAAAKARHKC